MQPLPRDSRPSCSKDVYKLLGLLVFNTGRYRGSVLKVSQSRPVPFFGASHIFLKIFSS